LRHGPNLSVLETMFELRIWTFDNRLWIPGRFESRVESRGKLLRRQSVCMLDRFVKI
jgi:hypothetical protein